VDEGLGRSLVPLLTEAARRKVSVVVVTQAHHNPVDLTLYESGAIALGHGAISGADLTASAAVVKLMHALAYCRSVAEVTRYIRRPLAGELGESSE
jgi:L-asparaginase